MREGYIPIWSGRSKAEIFRYGVECHQTGQLDRAEAAYRHVLALAPEDADALHLLGVLRYQQQHHEQAIDYIGQAIRLQSDRVHYYNSAALACMALGHFAGAEDACRQALRRAPEYPVALGTLVAVLRATGRLDEAEPAYRQALRLRPDDPDLHNGLGLVLRALGRPAEAEQCYRAALRLQPGLPEAHNNLGTICNALGRPAEAEASYRTALRLRPDYWEAHANLGSTLRQLNRLDEAEASLGTALRLKPDLAEAHNGLGNIRLSRGDAAGAEASHRTAQRLKPDYAEAHSNHGDDLLTLGRLAEAEESYRTALSLKPDFPDGHYNLGHFLLLAGRLSEGWAEYEWRIAAHGVGRRDFTAPQWNGEALGGRTLLLHAEQGFGDTLQFCRYVPLIAGHARLVLEVQAPLLRLLSGLPGVDCIVAQGDKLPAFDVHCPLLSVPRLLGTTLDTIPGKTPYLTADRQDAAAWHRRLASLDGLKIGLVWAGGIRPEQPLTAISDARRSMALDRLAPLADIDGVSFVSLQKGEPAAQAARPPRGMVLHDFTADLRDFADTAALIDALDLVISVDTAVAHLAGALGKPVWLLNRFLPCWRWLLERDDSPWYPTLRQFRQPVAGDWDSVIAAVKAALVHRIRDR